MLESTAAGEGLVQLLAAGTAAKGQYRCSDCGYGITIHAVLPVCPMCSGTSWEAVPWTPLSGTADFARRQRRTAAPPARQA